MAKRTRAPARRSRAKNTVRRSRAKNTVRRSRTSKAVHTPRKTARPQSKSPPPVTCAETPAEARRAVGIPITFTPELLAHGRYRYECTEEPRAYIAADLGIHRNTLRALALREGWKRFVPPARGLLPAVRLLAEAKKLEEIAPVIRRQSDEQRQPKGEKAAPLQSPRQDGAELATAGVLAGLSHVPAMVERIISAVQEELDAVKTMRAQLKREPQNPQDAERTARTISTLTDTLQKLQRLQCGALQTGSDNDDRPADIDEVRNELARRIDAFVASWTEPEDADDAAATDVVAQS
jgi:hypothetical protein